jgi:hypothetical protein
MKVAIDVDGCIDAAPRELQSLCSALIAAGHEVDVVTGNSDSPVTAQDRQEKLNYLNSLGF